MVQLITKPDEARQWLTENPDKIQAFDLMYGNGSGSSILDGTYTPEGVGASMQQQQEQSASAAQPEDQTGVFGTILNNLAEIPSALAQGVLNAGVQAGNTMANMRGMSAEDAQSLRDSEQASIESLSGQPMEGQGLADFNNNTKKVVADLSRDNRYNQHDLMQKFGFDFKEPSTIAGGFTKGIAQFVTGFLMLGGAKTFAGSMLKGGVVDATVFDPYEANLARMAQDAEWTGPAIDNALSVLANDPNDPEWVNRFKNTVDGAITGLALEGVIRGIKFIATSRRAKKEIKQFGKLSDETAADLDNAHQEAAATEQQIKETGNEGLQSLPDGTFVAPDGITYRPEGDKLVAIPKEDMPIGEVTLPDGVSQDAWGQIKVLIRNKDFNDKVTSFKPVSLFGEDLEARFGPEAKKLYDDIMSDPAFRDEFVNGPKQAPTAPDVPATDIPPQALDNPEGIPPTSAVDNADAPTQPLSPDNPQTPDQILRADLQAQAAPTVIQPKAKVPILDEETLRASVRRFMDMSMWDIRNIDDGGALNFSRMQGEGLISAAKIMDTMHSVLMETVGGKGKMGWGDSKSLDAELKDALKFLSDETGENVNNLIKNLGATETISRDLAAKIIAGKMALQSTGNEIHKLASLLEEANLNGTANEAMDANLIDAMQIHLELQANVKGLQTSAARATSAGRVVTTEGLNADMVAKLSIYGGSAKVRKLAAQLARIKAPKGRANLIRKAQERKWLGVLNEYWINQILSGYATHALNLTSNTASLIMRPVERTVGGALTGNTREMKAGLYQLWHLRSSVKESLHMAAVAGWDSRALLDVHVRPEIINTGTAPRKMSAEYLGIKNKALGSSIDIVGKILTMPSRALGTEDEFFKQMAYRSNVMANVSVDAALLDDKTLLALGYKTRDEFIQGESYTAFVTKNQAEEKWQELVVTGKVADDPKVKAEYIDKNLGSANVGNNKYAAQALADARQTTFTNPLRKGPEVSPIENMAAKFQAFTNEFPLLKQLTPFIQTPTNIMLQAWDRTPVLNLLKKDFEDALKSTDPAVKAEAVGKMATGVVTVTSLAYMAAEGKITGGGPSDPKIASLWRNSKDWQPYSINFGTVDSPNWVSYQRLDPWTTLFGVVGDMQEMMQLGHLSGTDAGDYLAATAAAVGNNITSKTYLQGISDFTKMMDSKDRPEVISNMLTQRASSFVPFSGMGGQLGNALDDNVREVRGLLDAVKNKTLIARGSLPIKYDWITGKAMETPDNYLGYVKHKALSPEDKDIALINSEMRKLNYGFTGAERKLAGTDLSPAQYQEYNKLIGTVEVGGKTLSERMVSIINSDRYNKDAEDYNMVTPQESHRVTLLNTEVARYRERARRELMRQYPDIKTAVRKYDRWLKISKRRGNAGERPETDMNNLFNQ